jgi:polyvinyl alcohol dehydrogenase (cytochrome)
MRFAAPSGLNVDWRESLDCDLVDQQKDSGGRMKPSTGAAAAAVFALTAVLASAALSQTPSGAGAEGPPQGGGRAGGGGMAQIQAHGEAVFDEHCAACHDPAIERAPDRAGLAAFWPDQVIASLTSGVMQAMATGLSEEDINDVAVYLTGRQPSGEVFDLASEDSNRCAAGARFDPAGPSWNGWSPDLQNTRVAADTSIGPQEAPRLQVKWAFAYQGGRYGQPTIVGNRVFVTSSSGRAYALDKETGCVAWTFSAPAGIRVTPSIGHVAGAPSGYAAFFGDYENTVYAVDANSGQLLWSVKVDDHPRAVLTGAPVLYQDTLYVPLSSWEETVANAPNYECCKAQGAVIAINVQNGEIRWKQYTIPTRPAPFKINSAGTQMYGPAGAAIWSAPTIDPARNVLYVATGDSYTDVVEEYSDAIVAMDLDTGAIKWANQVTPGDAFLMGCGRGSTAPNCPTLNGPDHDFGASPILKTLPDGRDLIFAGQKSGEVYALDPDNDGEIVWKVRIGNGGALGGVEWGMAADDANVYAAVNQGGLPSLTALRLTDGALMWHHRAPTGQCSFEGRCGNGYSGPPSLANGVLYGVNQDGHVRAFIARTGEMIWDYDTAGRSYQTVNGVADQRGGNLDATGITFAGSMGFLMAGYNGASSSSGPDNVLLAFSVGGD